MARNLHSTWIFLIMLWNEIFPFLPLLAYIFLCILTIKRQSQCIPDRRHAVLDTRGTTNLTLVGFSFAVISLLVTLFKDQIGQVSQSIYLLSISLLCFFGSYVLLYLRLRRWFDTISEGLTNNGIWTILWGMKELFLSFKELEKSSTLFSIIVLLFLIYIGVDLRWKWNDRKKEG